jgi:hypothetical protein
MLPHSIGKVISNHSRPRIFGGCGVRERVSYEKSRHGRTVELVDDHLFDASEQPGNGVFLKDNFSSTQ